MNFITLGPKGTYSHEAALNLFSDREIELAPNFEAIFDVVASGKKLGFVPFENSLHGAVGEVLDLLVESKDIAVWQMHDVNIHHALGGQARETITTIASHSQALAQCRRFLKKEFPNAERLSVSSTAYAIKMAHEDPTVAAIASKQSIESSGLSLIQDELEENGNTTRFALIATENPFPDLQRAEMGIVFHPTGDKPGLLHDILSPFKIYNINLTKIENRPTGKGFGDYHFFLHFQGSSDNPHIQQTLRDLEEMEGVDIVKVLGEW